MLLKKEANGNLTTWGQVFSADHGYLWDLCRGIILSVDVVEAASGSFYRERHRSETENRNRTFGLQGKRNFRAHRNLSRHTKSKAA